MTESNLKYISSMLKISKKYSDKIIEATLIKYICNSLSKEFSFTGEFVEYDRYINFELLNSFENLSIPIDINIVIEFFEALLDKDNIEKNGIIFTPRYIADFITLNTISYNPTPYIIDPSCGCGIFLISAAEILHSNLKISYVKIINNHIYGIDLDPDNVRRCKIILNLFVILKGESNKNIKPNVICADSLRIKWTTTFSVDSFDYIIGNPPYVNTHDMTKETALFLKNTFLTTKNGVYNIFYAFIEHAMKFLNSSGKLSYIVPNNFLTIKSATDLRKFLVDNQYLEQIIDFSENMVFKPIRTYNCIICLSKEKNKQLKYCILEKCNNIQQILQNITFDTIDIQKLDNHGWKLVDKKTLSNLQKIEGQFFNIRKLIRTGIATLKDEIYMVDFDGNDYYKIVNGCKYNIEKSIVKHLYKIPDLKQCTNPNEKCRFIIFPYKKGNNGFEIIPEKTLQTQTPLAYNYLLTQKNKLDLRDKGKKNPVAWYAYGRTQGLNKYGKKLLFPTFASTPRFTIIEDECALFCNGYAVFESEYFELSFLARILNSKIMNYYIKNTSYSIEGGYYCYQKKYIENFSIPYFSVDEIAKIENMDSNQLDDFLLKKYQITI